jgi:hypothetical protein
VCRAKKPLARDGGYVLPMALGIMVVLSISLATVLELGASGTRSTSASTGRNAAYATAERGLDNALAVLFKAPNYHSSTALPASGVVSVGPGLSYSYTGSLNDPVWTVTSTGYAQNKAQGSRPYTVTLTRKVSIQASAAGGVNTTIWNYIYSDALPGSCMNLSNNSALSTPLYVRGDLCLSNNAHVDANSAFSSNFPSTPQLQVGGKITLGNNAYIGSSSAPLNGVQTGAGCGSTPHNPCTTADNVWANHYLTTAPSFSKPVIDLATWYRDSYPGPQHACTSGSFPGGFDNNGVQDNSLGTVNLTPSSSYDCQFVDSLGNMLGRIAWNNGTKTMTVAGTLFWDGNLNFSQSVVYSGRATLYAAGAITIPTSVCGISGCTSSWDSSSNLMVLVAGSNAQSPSYAITMNNNGVFQGAMEANGDVTESNNVGIWGSVIAHQVFISNNAIDHYVPFGTPVPGQPAQSGYTETLVVDPNGFTG